MNILITLPQELWLKIVKGEKTLELRKNIPRKFDNYNSRCYVVLKGTDLVVGWFHISRFIRFPATEHYFNLCSPCACVNSKWISEYYKGKEFMVLWRIQQVRCWNIPVKRSFFVNTSTNPQCYCYTSKIYPR